MNVEEYKKQRDAFFAEAAKKVSELEREFAKEHNPVKAGDIIGDGNHRMEVKEMVFGSRKEDAFVPCMEYWGKPCDGRNQRACCMSQDSLETINGKKIKNHGYGEEN